MKLGDIIFKDLRVVLRDRVALMFIFLMPIVLIMILSFALGGMFAEESISIGTINVAVVDDDNAPEAAYESSLYALLDNEDIAAFLDYQVMDAAQAQAKLDNREADVIITIPKGFHEGVTQALAGTQASQQLSVVGSPNSTLKAGIAASIITSYTDTLSRLSADMALLMETISQSGGMTAQTMARLDIASFMRQLANAPTVDISYEGVAARKALSSFSYYSIAITCMFVLYSAGQGSGFLYTESEERTLQRLSAAGVSRRKLLIGKCVAVFLLCLLQLTVLLGFSSLVFGLDWGNPLVFLAISACVAVSVTGLGALLMVLVYRAGNPSIGNVFQSMIVQVFALLGGSFLPLAMLPAVFSTLALFTPNGLAVIAYTGNVSGAPLSEILPYMAGNVGLGIVLFIIGTALFPRERRT